MLRDEKRTRPVVLVSAAQGEPRHLVVADEVGDILAGVAHVYAAADVEPCQKLCGHVPEDLWCVDGAVRVYWPMPSASPARLHRIWRPREIGRDEASRLRFKESLLVLVAEAAVYANDDDELTWLDVESERRRVAMEQVGVRGEYEQLVKIADAEIRAKEDRISALEDELTEARFEAERAQAGERSWRESYEGLAAGRPPELQLWSCRTSQVVVEEAVAQARVAFPGKLVFSLNGKSDIPTPYQEPTEVLEAMRFLATTYHGARTGQKPCADFDVVLRRQCRWFYRGTQSDVTMGKYAEWYTATVGKKKVQARSPHWFREIEGPASIHSRSPLHGLKEEEKVVVGFIGQHQRDRWDGSKSERLR